VLSQTNSHIETSSTSPSAFCKSAQLSSHCQCLHSEAALSTTGIPPASPSKVNHNTEEANDNHSNSAQNSIPYQDAEPFPKPIVYIPKTPQRNLTSIQLKSIENLPVRCTIGVPPSSANSCIQEILGNGESFIPKDHVPAGFPITYYDAAFKPPKMD